MHGGSVRRGSGRCGHGLPVGVPRPAGDGAVHLATAVRAMAATALRRVVVTRKLPAAVLEGVRACDGGVTVEVWDHDEPIPRRELLRMLEGGGAGTHGLLCMLSDTVDAAALDAAKHLAVVSTVSVGVSHIDVPACVTRGVRIGYTPGVLTDATADLVVGLLLATARHIPAAATAVRTGEWSSWQLMWMCGKAVAGQRVGIVGLGRIGSAVARRLRGFGCAVQYWGKSGRKAEVEADVGATYAPLDEVLSANDIVIVLCALTPDTRGLLNADRLCRMKQGAMLINASRGEVVVQDDLVRILTDRPDLSAGLDVTTPEPLPMDHPLLSLPNCLVLPHIGSATTECRTEMARISAANLCAGLAGLAMPAELPETHAAWTAAAGERVR